MQPLRVVQVSFHADRARRGADDLLRAWPTLVDVATAVGDAGAIVSVVQAASAREDIRRADVDFHFVPDDTLSRLHVARRVAALEPDVVHVQGFGHPIAMRQLALHIGSVPILVQDHGGLLPGSLRSAAWRWGHRRINGAAFTARAQAAPWKKAGILRSDVRVFEILESSTHFTPGDQATAQRELEMSGDPCLLWTGTLDANKDPLALLEAFELAAAELPGARLYMCHGNAPLLGAVSQKVASSSMLSPRVVVLGRRPHEELEGRFRAADFFVQMSHREGSGYSVIEALACGTTPLVTDIPALRAIVGDDGALVPCGNARAMRDAIVEWASRDRDELRRRARARFDSSLTFAHVGTSLVDAYDNLCDRPRALRAPAALSVMA